MDSEAVLCWLLAAIVGAFILNRDFRDAVVRGNGTVGIGPLSAKGVTMVLLCALFVSGILYARRHSTLSAHHAALSTLQVDIEYAMREAGKAGGDHGENARSRSEKSLGMVAMLVESAR